MEYTVLLNSMADVNNCELYLLVSSAKLNKLLLSRKCSRCAEGDTHKPGVQGSMDVEITTHADTIIRLDNRHNACDPLTK